MVVVECVDCLASGVTRYRPTTGIRVKRCVTHVRARVKAQKAHSRSLRRSRVYGLSQEDWEALRAIQGGVCAICGPRTGNRGASKALAHDHDHTCCDGPTSCGDCVRGLLCTPCNRFLGHIRDDVESVLRMAEYLADPPWQKVLRSR